MSSITSALQTGLWNIVNGGYQAIRNKDCIQLMDDLTSVASITKITKAAKDVLPTAEKAINFAINHFNRILHVHVGHVSFKAVAATASNANEFLYATLWVTEIKNAFTKVDKNGDPVWAMPDRYKATSAILTVMGAISNSIQYFAPRLEIPLTPFSKISHAMGRYPIFQADKHRFISKLATSPKDFFYCLAAVASSSELIAKDINSNQVQNSPNKVVAFIGHHFTISNALRHIGNGCRVYQLVAQKRSDTVAVISGIAAILSVVTK